MSNWKQTITQVVGSVDDYFDALQFKLRQKRGLAPAQILTFIGHGTHTVLYLRGRAIEDYSVVDARDTDSMWRNMLNMYRRFNSREIPYARVEATFAGKAYPVRADDEGYFNVRIELDNPLPDDVIWHDIMLELLDYPSDAGARTVGKVIVPPKNAQFGVISDLDDTVIKSDVVNVLKLVRNTFLYNSHTRLPFAGVAEFYHALQKGAGQGYNPIFYVSNSPWNLYDLLVDFFEVRGIPLGTFFLTDMGFTPTKFIRTNGAQNKFGTIKTLLETHPTLPFILIGDSGEKDPEIYLKAVQTFPGRIRAIYIRDVTNLRRDSQVAALIQQAASLGAEMLLVPDTAAASAHALARGYIAPEAIPAIREEKREDEKKTSAIEALIDKLP